MQTQGHLILNLGILGRKEHPEWTWPIMLGALYPDAGLFGFYFWVRFVRGLPDSQIWRTEYFLESWQTFFSIFNSIPLALVGMAIGLYYKRSTVAVFFAAAILHCLEDLPLHHDDGHRHFWPLTNFRYESPMSYWDVNNNAIWGAGIELVLVLAASYWVWKRTQSRWGRGLLIVVNLIYALSYSFYFQA